MTRSLALFGTVAVLLSATVALTLSRATLFAGGVGSLKCYDKGGIEKPCWTPLSSFNVWASASRKRREL
jgi:hypothetical protein